MKIYISFDFEGLAGVTNWKETLDNSRFNYLATEQLNAFLKGFFRSNPNGEVYISDSHSYGNNLIYEKIIGNSYLIKGFPREFYMMQELDSSFDAVVYFGYHSPVGILGNMDHTYSSSSFFDIFINDKKVSEVCINSLIASYYKVPVKFVYTDSATKSWIGENLSDKIKILQSKKVISRYAAVMPSYEEILEKLEESGRTLSDNFDYFYPLDKCYNVKIVLLDTNIAYGVSIVPFVKQLDDRTVEFKADNPLDLYKKLMTLILVASSIKKV